MSITAPNTQTVGKSLTLQCSVTTVHVRGITSRVDIVWSSDGTELARMNGTSGTLTGNTALYTYSYTIPQLSICDTCRQFKCLAVIKLNADLVIMVNDSIKLDVTGTCNVNM